MSARLEVISALGAGRAIEKLKLLAGPCSQVRRVDNNDTFTGTIHWPASVKPRTPIRLTTSDGTVSEYRVTTVDRHESGTSATIQAAGPWLSIARGGLIRAVSEGLTVYSFGAKGRISELLAAYFIPNLATDGLDWIDETLGPIEDDALCEVSFTGWNRTLLLNAIVEQTGYEPYLYQSAPGTRYQIAFATRRGADAAPFIVASRTNLLRYHSAHDDTEIVTAVRPLGAVGTGDIERAGLSENAWTVDVIDSEWVTLLDPAGLVTPIAFDGQLNGLFLESATTTTPVYREILASRMSDQAVKLASTSNLTATGQLVRICANATGDPLDVLVNPEGVNAYDVVEATEDVETGRGERNWVQNGGFLEGNGGWTPGASGFVETHPATETTDVLGLMNGTVAPSSGSIVVDGFPANTVVRRYDLLRVEGTDLCTAPAGSGHTVKSDGKAMITGVSPLAYSLTDGQTLAMEWDAGTYGGTGSQSVVVDGAHSAGATTLTLKSIASVTRQLTNGDKIQFEYGGAYTGQSRGKLVLSNATGSPIVETKTITLVSDSFQNLLLNPTTTNLTTGDALTLSDAAGNTFSATATSDYVFGSSTLYADVTIPDGTLQTYSDSRPLTITAVKTDTVLKTLTNASVEFSEAGLATATWSGGLAASYSTARARWMDASSVLIAYLTVSSGAAASATSAVLSYPTRARIFPGAAFNNGSIGADLLFCNSTVTLDGAGAGTITLLAFNTNSLPDNATVRLFRNTAGWSSDTPVVNVLRTVNGATSASFPMIRRGTSARTAWAVVHGSLWVPVATNFFSSKGTPNSFPVTLEINDGTGTYTNAHTFTVPASWQTDDRPLPFTFSLKQSFSLTANRMVTFKISASDCTHLNALIGLYVHSAQVMVTGDEDAPFTNTSHANVLWQRANRRLLDADMAQASIQGTVIDFSQIPHGMRVPRAIALGQSVEIRDANATQRAMQITCDPRFPAKLEIDFDRDRPFLEQLVA